MTREWSYTYVRGVNQKPGKKLLEDLLDKGWEPINANDSAGFVTVHLRLPHPPVMTLVSKKVAAEPEVYGLEW